MRRRGKRETEISLGTQSENSSVLKDGARDGAIKRQGVRAYTRSHAHGGWQSCLVEGVFVRCLWWAWVWRLRSMCCPARTYTHTHGKVGSAGEYHGNRQQ